MPKPNRQLPAPAKAGQPAPATPPANASGIAPVYGGLRGGRPRQDGLVPGSREAEEADREKDRVRKEAARAYARKLEEQPALPSAAQPPVAGPGNNGAPLEAPPVAAWSADMVRPAWIQVIVLAEDAQIAGTRKRCIKAGLDKALEKELCADAAWPVAAKKGLETSGSEVLADGLNTLGLDSRWRHVLTVVPSVVMIAQSRLALNARLEKLIAQRDEALKKGVQVPNGAPAAS